MTKERFLEKTEKTDSCWIWRGGVKSKKRGYGTVKVAGKNILAHRYSYSTFVGDIPDGMFVCHTCDNPQCVNPSHLFVGSRSDNMKDAWNKGRLPALKLRNRFPPASAKLSVSNVVRVRTLIKEGRRINDIAKLFSVTRYTISRIKRQKTYLSIP